MPGIIHEAGAADAAAVADIHIASWREAYRDILPDAYLKHDVVEERRRYWAAKLRDAGDGAFVLVAAAPDAAQGFISVAREGEPGYDAVIESLHVSRAFRGTGLGRKLIGAAAGRLIETGATSVCLRVYDDNLPAIRFYEHLGGRKDGTGIDPFAGANKPDTRFGWRDLAALRDACRNGRP